MKAAWILLPALLLGAGAAQAAIATWVSGTGSDAGNCPITAPLIVDEAIHITLGSTGGNLSAAARILGISRPTLMRKLRDEGTVRRTILASS